MSTGQHILVVDDDPAIRELIADYLGDNEMDVSVAADGVAMDQILADRLVDLIVLDIKLPGEDGLSLARKIRSDSDIPIIMLTGRSDEIDRVLGLELGADDYLTKPFSPRELLARIKAILRRSNRELNPASDGIKGYRFAGWELNRQTRGLLSPERERISLTNGEFTLLVALLSASQRVLSRDQLLDMCRIHDDEVFDRSIDVQILRLRRKLEVNPSQPELIKTERGAGYIFTPRVEVY